MKDFSITMALVDYIPVIFFGLGAAVLMQCLYNKMTKASFSLFAAGSINVFMAGFLKATYKLLYAANICDFEPLNSMFFPVQALGFLLAGSGIMLMYIRKKNLPMLSVAPVVWKGTFLFVGFMVLGLAFMDAGLCYLAVKVKKPRTIVLYVVSFFCCLAMGYLSSRDFTQASMNWIAQGINVVGQGFFLLGALSLKKAGLEEYTFPIKK